MMVMIYCTLNGEGEKKNMNKAFIFLFIARRKITF